MQSSTMRSWRCAAVALFALVCCAARAAAAPPHVEPPADKLNTTDTASAFQAVQLYPQMSLITSNIKGSPRMKSYLDKPGQILTAFPTTNEFSRHFLSKLGRYAGVALQNESFTGAIFDAMIVPGKAWTAADLYKAAPIELKTLGGDGLKVVRDPQVPYGILINGAPIQLGNQATKDKKVVIHIVDGGAVPTSQKAIYDYWTAAGSSASESGPAKAAGAEAAAAAASGAAGSRGGAAAAVAAAAAALALLL